MLVRRYLLGSSVVILLVACASEKLPLGEGDTGVDKNDSGAGASGASGAAGTDGASGAAGTGGQSASGGSAGSGGGTPSDCRPTAEICYGDRPASSPGNECLANIDNTGTSRVQFRQTWARAISPPGMTSSTARAYNALRTSLSLSECHTRGNGGGILISSWDRSNPDIAQQTLTAGFARPLASGQVPTDKVLGGLCFADWSYTYAGPAQPTSVPIARWADLTDVQPWRVAPTVYQRVAADFTTEAAFNGTAQGDSRVFINENTGYIHAFTPKMMVSSLNSATEGFALPMYAVETKWKFNDGTFNCAGRFRSDALTPETECGRDSAERTSQWGCADDSACPPGPEFGSPGTPDAGPGYTTGFYLIVDLERVFTSIYGATLCVVFAGLPTQTLVEQGWAASDPDGANCRGGSRWNPDLPDDAGLPPGDWCSRTNSPATTTCHDAYRSVSYGAAQAFKVLEGTCSLQ
jgi:hypothetical protein